VAAAQRRRPRAGIPGNSWLLFGLQASVTTGGSMLETDFVDEAEYTQSPTFSPALVCVVLATSPGGDRTPRSISSYV